MRRLLTFALIWSLATPVGLAGFAGVSDRQGWQRELERLGVDLEGVIYPFRPSPEMEAWAAGVLRDRPAADSTERLMALQRALFAPDFGFEYDAGLTLTADRAFAARSGNCMSFTALFVTLARLAEVDAFLMSVTRAPEVDRSGGLVVVNRHVVAAYRAGPGSYKVFDFYLRSTTSYVGERPLDDVTATAMFHTNLGADAIRAGDMEEAARHLDLATTLAPDWAPGWINLGVARNRSGDTDGALDAFRRALEADRHNSSALTNMAALYSDMGLEAEAQAALRAAAHQTTNPFTLVAMADAEMLVGRYGKARRYLRKARRWYPKEPEVQLALARLAVRMDNPERAARHQRKADDLARSQVQ